MKPSGWGVARLKFLRGGQLVQVGQDPVWHRLIRMVEDVDRKCPRKYGAYSQEDNNNSPPEECSYSRAPDVSQVQLQC